MDTGTHIISGIAIGVASEFVLKLPHEWTIFFVSITSSLIPDLDVILKIKSNNSYILNHRGITHTILIAPFLAIIAPLLMFTEYNSFLKLYLISLFAIIFHLFLDVLNPYGTKIIPRKNDFKFNVIYTFDPIFFSLLLIGTILSFFYNIFIIINLILIFSYIIFRFITQSKIKKKLKGLYPDSLNIYVLSKLDPRKWHIIIENIDSYIVGVFQKELNYIDTIRKTEIPTNYYNIVKDNKTFKAFTKKSYTYIYEETNEGFMLYDLKYRKNGFYYFKAYFKIANNKLTNGYLGFVFSDNKFQKKLDKKDVKK